MAYDEIAQAFLARWRRDGRAPLNESIVMNVSSTNPFIGETIRVTWQAVGPCVNVLVNGQTYLENQALDGQFSLDIPYDNLNPLVITGQCGPARVTREIKPRIIQPVIHRFEIEKDHVYVDDEFSVDWSVADATEISITLINESETVFYRNEAQGRIKLNASKTGECRAIIFAKSSHFGISNEAQISKEIKFNIIHRPISIDFSSSSDKIGVGESVTLCWRTVNAFSVKLVSEQGNLDVEPKGSTNLSIGQIGRHNFEVIAVGFAGIERKRISIICEAPVITMELKASATKVQPGDIVGLTWRVKGAEKVELVSPLLPNTINQSNGQLKFMLFASGKFTLSATGFDGRLVKKSIEIKVKLVPEEQDIQEELSALAELFGGD